MCISMCDAHDGLSWICVGGPSWTASLAQSAVSVVPRDGSVPWAVEAGSLSIKLDCESTGVVILT